MKNGKPWECLNLEYSSQYINFNYLNNNSQFSCFSKIYDSILVILFNSLWVKLKKQNNGCYLRVRNYFKFIVG